MATVQALRDGFGRAIEYVRLSVTDRCNSRCVYCLPEGCPRDRGQPLSLAEIRRLAHALAGMGVWKFRITGGEPTIRGDLLDVVAAVASTPGVRRVGLSTNGFRLAALVPGLRDAGVQALNVSLDSLDRVRQEHLTGFDRRDAVIEGVEKAIAAGIPSVKVNAVLLPGLEDAEVDRFVAWTRDLPLTVRFIELMRTGSNAEFFQRNHVSALRVRRRLEAGGWSPAASGPDDGPATRFRHPDHRGQVGLITPYSAGFCATCNRVRVSSSGDLRLCLFGEEQVPLRPWIQRDDQEADLRRVVEHAVQAKPRAHHLKESRSGTATTLAAIGG